MSFILTCWFPMSFGSAGLCHNSAFFNAQIYIFHVIPEWTKQYHLHLDHLGRLDMSRPVVFAPVTAQGLAVPQLHNASCV